MVITAVFDESAEVSRHSILGFVDTRLADQRSGQGRSGEYEKDKGDDPH